jgi:hypothetical protein
MYITIQTITTDMAAGNRGSRSGPDRSEMEAANRAINLARLWRAGKMIGGDQDQVIDALLSEVDRLRAIAHEHWHIVHEEYCGSTDCTSKGGTKQCHALKPVGIEPDDDALATPS